MASSTSFKQQCPSCEAMVPIRDPGLIGRKIDCPKCKYRFVVEEPAEEPEEAEDEAPAKAAKNKAPAKGKTPAKGGPRRRDEDDDAEDEKPAKKKAGKSNVTMMLGAGL